MGKWDEMEWGRERVEGKNEDSFVIELLIIIEFKQDMHTHHTHMHIYIGLTTYIWLTSIHRRPTTDC